MIRRLDLRQARFLGANLLATAAVTAFIAGSVVALPNRPTSTPLRGHAHSKRRHKATPQPSYPPPEHSVPEDMVTIMVLLRNHDKIKFVIRPIPGGARTITTSTDPDVVKAIQLHAHEMKDRVILGNNIRPTDPLFIAIFEHHNEIKDVITDLPNGVSEDETSTNPQVTILIRAHAKRVAGFVKEGLPAAQRSSPLPPGYHPGPDKPKK